MAYTHVDLFPLGEDTTPYRKLGSEGVSVEKIGDREVLNVSREAILELNIPTGIPLLFELDDQLAVQSFRYLGDPEAAKKAAEAVANQGKAHG